jgi:hypothetical protein
VATLPIAPVVRPADLAGVTNGKLPGSLLTNIGAPGRASAVAHSQCNRSWQALRAEVLALFGETLTVTSSVDAYRDYARQESTFRGSYLPKYDPARCTTADSRTWNGVRWYKLSGHSAKAVPGTSNHGWALALDVCLWRNDTIVGITANSSMFNWLVANAARYGFSWEMQSEPWHLRLFTGDRTPQAVTDYEAGQAPTPPIPPNPSPNPPTKTDIPMNKTTLDPAKRDALKGNGDVQLFQVHSLGLYQMTLASGAPVETFNIGTVDADYGPRTQAAAVLMQQLNQVTADGIVGPQSWAKFLNSDGE